MKCGNADATCECVQLRIRAGLSENSLDTSWVRARTVQTLPAVHFLVGNGSAAVVFYTHTEVQVTTDFCNGQELIVLAYV